MHLTTPHFDNLAGWRHYSLDNRNWHIENL